MIDIQKLKQFPLSFKAFEGYIEKQYGNVLFIYNGSGIVKNEDCLLFLDSNSVFVDINPVGHSDFQIKYFEYCVLGLCNYTGRFLTRTEAVNESILTAFKLLENKLKTN